MLGAEPQLVPDSVHVGPDVVPVNSRAPLGGGKQPGENGHCGGLAGPVVAQERGDLSLVELHRQLVQRLLAVTVRIVINKLDFIVYLIKNNKMFDFYRILQLTDLMS